MRFTSLIKKALIENFRDWKIIILTLTFAPFFVFLMHMYYGDTTRVYDITVLNRDKGVELEANRIFNAGKELISELKTVISPEGKKVFKVYLEDDMEKARQRLNGNLADLVVEIPVDFSRVLLDFKKGGESPPAVVKNYGNPSNIDYIMAAVWCDTIAFQYTAAQTGWKGPLELQSDSIKGTKSLKEFDLFVPGLLVLSLIMLMFTAAASLIKEKDKGTIIRLQISNMKTFEWISAVSIIQVFIGLLALGLAFLSALSVGYETSGSIFSMMVVGLLSSLSVMAISVIVAAVLRTVFDLMTIGTFPFFILMFFSGGMFPLPKLHIFSIGGRWLNANDILPTTHTIRALNKLLNYNAGLDEVLFEIGAIVFLTVLFFIIGIWMFTRRHMRA